MPLGRPTKYQPAYCEAVIAHCKDGASLTSFAADIGVARSTINEWIANHPEFSEAAARAKAVCAAWWERAARANAVRGEGNATLCVFGLKNMGADDWSDTHELKHSGAVTVDHREAAQAEVQEIFGPTPHLIESARG
jgi:hypothetical protein